MANPIPTILRGDDSGSIDLTMATGRSYTGATLVVAYQGVTRKFTNLTPGGTVSLMFTHAETAAMTAKTAPVLMRLVGATGGEETVENAEARIKVTDNLAEVNAGGSFTITPGAGITDPTKVPITDVGDLSARYSLADLKAKVDQIVRVLAQRSLLSLLLSACCLSGFAAVEVQTARLDSLYNDDLVVTNVTQSGEGGGVSTNAVNALIADYDATNLTARINAKENTISDLATIRSGAAAGATALQPNEESDPLSLHTADTNEFAAGILTVSGRDCAGKIADATNALAEVAHSGKYSDLNGTPTLAAVATSGAYSDLSGTPTLAAVATSGNYSDLNGKPTIPAEYTDAQARAQAVDVVANATNNLASLTIKTNGTDAAVYNGTANVSLDIATGGGSGGSVAWEDVTGKPNVVTNNDSFGVYIGDSPYSHGAITNSLAVGNNCMAYNNSLAVGDTSWALRNSVVLGSYCSGRERVFVWSGKSSIQHMYTGKTNGSFCVDPVGGLQGFYIGNDTLFDLVDTSSREYSKYSFSSTNSATIVAVANSSTYAVIGASANVTISVPSGEGKVGDCVVYCDVGESGGTAVTINGATAYYTNDGSPITLDANALTAVYISEIKAGYFAVSKQKLMVVSQ